MTALTSMATWGTQLPVSTENHGRGFPRAGSARMRAAYARGRVLLVTSDLSKKRAKRPLRGSLPTKPPAQSFKFTVPGGLFQSKKDLKIPVELGFTKGNELFVGRLAMIGFAASLLGENLTGKGALAQFDIETGLPLADTEPLVLALILFNLFAAFGGVLGLSSGRFEAPEGVEQPQGDVQRSLARPREFFGITKFGFSKENELFVGRVAMLGFAASLIGEVVTGLGPLAQFGLETGIPLSESEPTLLFFIALIATLAINEGSGTFKDE